MGQTESPRSLKTYASKVQLAEIFGVSISTIKREMPAGLCKAAGALVRGRWRFDVTKAWEYWRNKGT